MGHCDFEKGSRNQHFQSTLLVRRQGGHKKEYSVYALDYVDNNYSGRPHHVSSSSSPCPASMPLQYTVIILTYIVLLSIQLLLFWHFSSVYSFPDSAALTDLLYISRSSAVRPTLQTLASIQSSTSFSQHLFGLPPILWPSPFPSSTSVWCLFICLN